MDQTRLNFLNLFYNHKNYNIINCNFLKDVDFDITPEYYLKTNNNNTYFEKKKLKKKIGLISKIELKKVYNNSYINNIIFF